MPTRRGSKRSCGTRSITTRCTGRYAPSPRRSPPTRSTRTTSRSGPTTKRASVSASSRASSLQASNAFASAGAAAPDEFYDQYTLDLDAEGNWSRARRSFFRHRLAVAGLFILAGLFAAALLAGLLARYGYNEPNIDALSASPSWAHPFGTDQTGR